MLKNLRIKLALWLYRQVSGFFTINRSDVYQMAAAGLVAELRRHCSPGLGSTVNGVSIDALPGKEELYLVKGFSTLGENTSKFFAVKISNPARLFDYGYRKYIATEIAYKLTTAWEADGVDF